MLKKLVLISLFIVNLYSKELNTEKFQILASEINTKKETIIAKGSVVIFSKSYYLSSKKAIYNKNDESFELFGNVLILKDNHLQSQSDYALFNTKTESYNVSPLLLFEKNDNLWASSQSAKKNKTKIFLGDSIISSCDCIDPVWSIKVSSATYDTKDKWFNAYNPKLYIKDIPIFYSPYLGFSSDTTRRTGLLTPTIGYSNTDGVYYSQSLFIAPQKNYDLEIIPQVRNQRGQGVYAYLRYADSAYSQLKLKSGIFSEKSEYQQKNDIENKRHFGWNIDYERTKLFSSDDNQDGLYLSLTSLNDVEYRTLENLDNSTSSEKKVESKLNYFFNTSKYYTGIYGRYYVDTELDSNDTTLQKLPEIQVHKYNEKLFSNLLYSLDAKATNYTRQDGVTANIYELSLPLSYSKYFLKDYLYTNIENTINANKLIYANHDNNYKNATLVQNETSFLLGTDLIKPYENILHTMNLSAKYIFPRNLETQGDLYEITNNDTSLSSFPISQGSRSIYLSLNESFYSRKTSAQIVNHKLSQSILYVNNEPELHDLENYLIYKFQEGSISNKLTYNVEDKQFIENTIDFKYAFKNLGFSSGYYKSKNTTNSNKEDLESYEVNLSYKMFRDYKLTYYENYNLLKEIKNKQGLSLDIKDRCWDLSLKYEKELTPSSSDVEQQNIIYLNLSLKPLGGIKQTYTVKGN